MRWQISRKGNHWVKLPDATLTAFRAKDERSERWGWRGCITRSAKEGPIFGELLHAEVEDAKASLLLKYVRMGGRLESPTKGDD